MMNIQPKPDNLSPVRILYDNIRTVNTNSSYFTPQTLISQLNNFHLMIQDEAIDTSDRFKRIIDVWADNERSILLPICHNIHRLTNSELYLAASDNYTTLVYMSGDVITMSIRLKNSIVESSTSIILFKVESIVHHKLLINDPNYELISIDLISGNQYEFTYSIPFHCSRYKLPVTYVETYNY